MPSFYINLDAVESPEEYQAVIEKCKAIRDLNGVELIIAEASAEASHYTVTDELWGDSLKVSSSWTPDFFVTGPPRDKYGKGAVLSIKDFLAMDVKPYKTERKKMIRFKSSRYVIPALWGKDKLGEIGARFISQYDDPNHGKPMMWDAHNVEVEFSRLDFPDAVAEWNEDHDCCDVCFANGIIFGYVDANDIEEIPLPAPTPPDIMQA